MKVLKSRYGKDPFDIGDRTRRGGRGCRFLCGGRILEGGGKWIEEGVRENCWEEGEH